MIPKIFHQTWFTHDLSPLLRERVEFTKKQNPDWEYRLWDDDDIEKWLMDEGHEKDLERFKCIKCGPAKADLFRLLVCNYVGGVYMDLDNYFTEPISDWLHPDAESMVSLNKLQRVDFCLMGSVSGSSYVSRTLNKVRDNIDKRNSGKALGVTGPPNWRISNRGNNDKIQIVSVLEDCRPFRKEMIPEKQEYPDGQQGTPPKHLWHGPIKYVYVRDREPWSVGKFAKKKPETNWQLCGDIYH